MDLLSAKDNPVRFSNDMNIGGVSRKVGPRDPNRTIIDRGSHGRSATERRALAYDGSAERDTHVNNAGAPIAMPNRPKRAYRVTKTATPLSQQTADSQSLQTTDDICFSMHVAQNGNSEGVMKLNHYNKKDYTSLEQQTIRAILNHSQKISVAGQSQRPQEDCDSNVWPNHSNRDTNNGHPELDTHGTYIRTVNTP